MGESTSCALLCVALFGVAALWRISGAVCASPVDEAASAAWAVIGVLELFRYARLEVAEARRNRRRP